MASMRSPTATSQTRVVVAPQPPPLAKRLASAPAASGWGLAAAAPVWQAGQENVAVDTPFRAVERPVRAADLSPDASSRHCAGSGGGLVAAGGSASSRWLEALEGSRTPRVVAVALKAEAVQEQEPAQAAAGMSRPGVSFRATSMCRVLSPRPADLGISAHTLRVRVQCLVSGPTSTPPVLPPSSAGTTTSTDGCRAGCQSQKGSVSSFGGEVVPLDAEGEALQRESRDSASAPAERRRAEGGASGSSVLRPEADALWRELMQMRGSHERLAEELRLERETRGVGLAGLRAEFAAFRETIGKEVRRVVEEFPMAPRSPIGSEPERVAPGRRCSDDRLEELAAFKEHIQVDLSILQEASRCIAQLVSELRDEAQANSSTLSMLSAQLVDWTANPPSELLDLCDSMQAAFNTERRMREEMSRQLHDLQDRALSSENGPFEAQLALLREELVVKLEESSERVEHQFETHAMTNTAVLDSSAGFINGITQALDFERQATSERIAEVSMNLEDAIEGLNARLEVLSSLDAYAAGAGRDQSSDSSELRSMREELRFVDSRHGEEFTKCSELCESVVDRLRNLEQQLKVEKAARCASHAEQRAEIMLQLRSQVTEVEQKHNVLQEGLNGEVLRAQACTHDVQRALEDADARLTVVERLQTQDTAEDLLRAVAQVEARLLEKLESVSSSGGQASQQERLQLRGWVLDLRRSVEQLFRSMGAAEERIEEAVVRLSHAEERFKDFAQVPRDLQQLSEARLQDATQLSELLRQQTAFEQETRGSAEELWEAVASADARLQEQLSVPAAVAEPAAVAAQAGTTDEIPQVVGKRIEELEGRLVKRHENLVLTLNKDIGRLELRLEKQIEGLPLQSGGPMLTPRTAGDTRAFQTAIAEECKTHSANLQELGELVLGEIAALRLDSDDKFTTLQHDIQKESRDRQDECLDLGAGLAGLVDEIEKLTSTRVEIQGTARWSPRKCHDRAES
mmetsp:Transcript_100826/g.323571  ORF Transcript_100826/g.323571 Transcript_100826/m.323571 type:complete len:974 (-) Transcript_100826:114-3035(-)